jgi:hypothetical protein
MSSVVDTGAGATELEVSAVGTMLPTRMYSLAYQKLLKNGLCYETYA